MPSSAGGHTKAEASTSYLVGGRASAAHADHDPCVPVSSIFSENTWPFGHLVHRPQARRMTYQINRGKFPRPRLSMSTGKWNVLYWCLLEGPTNMRQKPLTDPDAPLPANQELRADSKWRKSHCHPLTVPSLPVNQAQRQRQNVPVGKQFYGKLKDQKEDTICPGPGCHSG